MIYGDIFSQRLTLVNTHVVADTIDYLEMKFSFKTDDWDGLEKWVHFTNGDMVYDIRLTDNSVRKEDHLNLSAGAWRVYLHGNRYSDGEVVQRITTGVAVIEVQPTGTLDGEPFPEMPASVTEQILARLDDVEQNGGGSGGGVQVDETLSKAGYAADAAAVGEALKKQSNAIADYGKQIESDTYKQSIADLVVAHLVGQPIVGVVDSDKHITLNGTLPVGTYTLKYEGENGEYSGIVELMITEEDKIAYTNVLPLAQEYASTNPYVGSDGSKGYGNNVRISTSSPTTTYMKTQTGVDATALLPVKRGDILRFKNCNIKVSPSNTSYGTQIIGFTSEKTVASGFTVAYNNISMRLPIVTNGDEIVQITLEPLEAWSTSNIDNVAYIMIGTDGLDETSVITINQEIV